jgi:hypothetical protein
MPLYAVPTARECISHAKVEWSGRSSQMIECRKKIGRPYDRSVSIRRSTDRLASLFSTPWASRRHLQTLRLDLG